MFKFIQDPTVTPKELAFCYKELQLKEKKLIIEKKSFYEKLLSLQHNAQTGVVSKAGKAGDKKRVIEELKVKIKNTILEIEVIVDEMEEMMARMAFLIPKFAQKRIDEIKKYESHTNAKNREKLFRKFLSTVAKAAILKQNINGKQGKNYNFEFKFGNLREEDKKFFLQEIEKIRDETMDNRELAGEDIPKLNDEKIELEKIIKGNPFTQVNKLLKEVGANLKNCGQG